MSMDEDIGHIKADVSSIREDQKKMLAKQDITNGRISVLERWQQRMLGFGACFVVASPLFVYEIRQTIAEMLAGG